MVCKIQSCGKPTVGKSSYCREHRVEVHKNFKAIIAEKAEEKAQREVEFQELWPRACEAGQQAAKTQQQQMVVALDEKGRPVGGSFPICGFGFVIVKPGNSAFANWLKKNNYARTDSYYGGVCIWISSYNQSYDLKYAHAKEMAKIFSEANIKAYAFGDPWLS
ncbi:MAG: hypothetical protein WC516_09015 [Patescibacteria group bacterium]|jgi:hypothetical protein